MERTDLEQWRAKEVARLLALLETERRYYQEMVASLPVALVVLAADRKVASANRAFRQLFSLKSDDLRGKIIDQILPSERLIEQIRDVHTSGVPQRALMLEQEGRALRIAVVPMRNWGDESEVETLLMVEDLREIEPREAEVREESSAPDAPYAPANHRFTQPQLTLGSVPALVWEADFAMQMFRGIFGDTERVLGFTAAHWITTPRFFAERIHTADRAAVMTLYQSAMIHGGEATAEFRCANAQGGSEWVRETIRVEGTTLMGVIVPIGRRKQLEAQIISSERVDALRNLTSRLAHDLNNPLMIINGYAEEIRDSLADDDARRGDADQILAATERISGIASQLLAFSRRQASPAVPVNLSLALSGMEEKLARAVGENVTLRFSLPAGPIWGFADESQLEEIMLAMVSKERESARERSSVTIGCELETITEQIPKSVLEPGTYARITIRDDGQGIDAARSRTLFESFLHKDAAHKNGSELTRAYAVAREWGGDISFSSEPFHGSLFEMYLPACAAPAPATGHSRTVEVGATEAPVEEVRETILLVEDEAGIRALVRKILRRERYTVLEAGTAEKAIEISDVFDRKIDLLVTDVMLADDSGRQVAERIREKRPNLKVLYVSGYTDDEAVIAGTIPPGAKFLQKPFTLGALVEKVREALAD